MKQVGQEAQCRYSTSLGYSERLALSIRSNLQEELEKRVGVGDNIRITKDMYLDRISTWDYYVPASERGSVEDVHLLLDVIPSRTRSKFFIESIVL